MPGRLIWINGPRMSGLFRGIVVVVDYYENGGEVLTSVVCARATSEEKYLF